MLEIKLIEDLGSMYPTKTSKHRARYGIFECFCGNRFKTIIGHIKSGSTKSCGCSVGKHKLSKHRLYNTWNGMMHRCYDITRDDYLYYGGRGITVCKEWHNVSVFILDMESSYKEGLTLDRKENNKEYSKDNCRWATKKTQSRNTRKLMKTNTSGYRGVSFHKRSLKFIARITINNKTINLGSFSLVLDAAKAYDKYILDNNLEHTRNGVLNEN